MRRFKIKTRDIVLIVCVIPILYIAVSEILIDTTAEEYIYTEISEIPENKVGLVLGTSKYTSDGRKNFFYSYRLDAARDLYDAKKIEYILVSWDNSTQQYNETDMMREDLVALWVPKEKIYGDYAGFSTLESVVRAKKIFRQ